MTESLAPRGARLIPVTSAVGIVASCRCDQLRSLEGVAARGYARDHLRAVATDIDNWRTLHVCPLSGQLWLEHYPHSERHGGGSPELRVLSNDEARELFPGRA